MDWADQFFVLLGAWLVCAIVSYVASRAERHGSSRVIQGGMMGSAVGFGLAVLSYTAWVHVFVEHWANIPPGVAQTLWRLLTFAGEYAPLSGAIVGGVVGCILPYAFRRRNAT